MNGTGKIKRVVVKIGSRVLSVPDGGVDEAFLSEFVGQIANLRERGLEVAVVSSGAIRIGAPLLNLDRRGLDIASQQAAAAAGQGVLISKYIDLFRSHGIVAAQVLLTPDITNYRKKYLNARNTLRALLAMGAVPVINENDTVAYEEIKFGDNDTLSAITAILVEADLLVLLSDVDGFYTGDPASGGRRLEEITAITPEIRKMAGGPSADGGFGGMATKIDAAQAVTESGISMIIAHGRDERILDRILGGEKTGTHFLPHETSLSGRKKWLAFGCRPEGAISVNEGAMTAILEGGKSLLPIGITGTAGSFEHGECVEICGPGGRCFARGLTNYSALEIEHIKGRKSSEIETILSFIIAAEVVHRDDMVLV